MKKLTREELHNRIHGLTVGELKRFLQNNPDLTDDAPVVIERVEDVYFEKHGWGVYLKEGEHYNYILNHNKNMQEEIDRRERGEEPEYEKIENPKEFIKTPTDEDMNQYVPTWCCVKHKDENILFIDLHC